MTPRLRRCLTKATTCRSKSRKLAATDQPELADQFLDFMLTEGFQSVIPETNWMYPAVTPASGLPEGFEAYKPAKSLLMTAEEAEAARDAALSEWQAAARPLELGAPALAVLLLALVLAPLAMVGWRGAGLALGPADWSAVRFSVTQAFLSSLFLPCSRSPSPAPSPAAAFPDAASSSL